MSFLVDLRVAVRTLLRAPGFFALASGVLALGIAVVVMMLGALRVTLSTPPLERADRVFSLVVRDVSRDDPERWVPRLDLEDWSRELTSFEAIAGTSWTSASVRREGAPAERYEAARVFGPLFSLLRVQPLLGRTLTAEDARPGASPVVTISERLWRTAFSADPALVGKSVRVDGQTTTIVGVVPASADVPVGALLWIPDRTDTGKYPRVGSPYFAPLGRLRDGVTPEAALAELRTVQGRRVARHPELVSEVPEVRPFSLLWMSGDYQRLFRILFGSVLLVLALACVNVAGLLLVRGAGRTHEAAVRRALGASRLRLAGQMLAETVVVGAFATLLALVLLEGGVELMQRVVPAVLPTAPSWWSFRLDGVQLAATLGAAAIATLGAGLYPALRTASVSIDPLLREGQRDTGLRAARLVRWLVVVEIALSSALLCTAGLVIRSAAKLGRGDVGVPTAGFLLARLELPPSRYGYPDLARFARNLRARLQGIPGVASATVTSAPPGCSAYWHDTYLLADRPMGRTEELPSAKIVQVDEGFFETFRVPVIEGRGIGTADREDTHSVAVVSRSFARSTWPGGDALGKQLRLLPHLPETPWLTVVGVAKDVRYDDRLDKLGKTPPTIYVPMVQWPGYQLYLMLRGPGDPMVLAPGVREAVRSLDADVAVYGLRPLDEERQRNAAGLTLIGGLFVIFGAVALALAAAGVYGVLSYSVAQSAREIAIRRALGAPDVSVVGAVLFRSGWQLLLGLALGLALAPIMGSLIGSTTGERSHPVAMYLGVAGVLLVTLLFSVLVPLRRALRLEPSAALRHT